MISLMVASFVALASVTAAPNPDNLPTATPVYAGVAISDADNDADAPDKVAPVSAAPKSSTPLLSINTDILDMNWASAMDFTDQALRTPIITLPFGDGYGVDNIEVKLRLLNLNF